MNFRSGLVLMAAFGSLGAASPKASTKAATSNNKPADSKKAASIATPAEPTGEPAPEVPSIPEWTQHREQFVTTPGREFMAVGQAGAIEAAEDDARQRLGAMIANWQERTLKCAQRESEKQKISSKADIKHAKDGNTVVSVETHHQVAVSLYKDELGERLEEENEGGKSYVQLKHSLTSLIEGIEQDDKRSEGLKEAVKACGDKTFDELAAPPAPTPSPEPKGKSKSKKK